MKLSDFTLIPLANLSATDYVALARTGSNDKVTVSDLVNKGLSNLSSISIAGTITGTALVGALTGTVGAATANSGAFTTLSASSTISGSGFSNYLASPPAIGSTAASTGAFTTLSASSTVTLSGGTASGLLYLNGSKQVTSGSALTFDGSTLEINSSTNGINLIRTGSTGSALNQFMTLNHSPGGGAYSYTALQIGGIDIFSAGLNLSSYGGNAIINSPGGTGSVIFKNYGSEQMRLTNTGLGIGTSSPAAKLHVNGGNARFTPLTNGEDPTPGTAVNGVVFTGGNGAYGTQFSVGSSGGTFIQAQRFDGGTSTYSLYLNISGGNVYIGKSSALTVDTSGNLGIGTSSPVTRLHVSQSNSGTYASVVLLSNSANAAADRTGIYGSPAPGTANPYRGGITFWPGANGAVSIHTGNNSTPDAGEAVRISSDGTFRVKGAGTAGSTDAVQFSGSAPANSLLLDSSGRLIVNTASAIYSNADATHIYGKVSGSNQYGLMIGGDASLYTCYAARFLTNNSGNVVGSITFSTSATAYNTSSDQRLKTDLGIATSTDVIDNTVIHDFEWKADGSKSRGVFAQEAHVVKPEAVSVGTDELNEDGLPVQPWGVDYSKYVPDLIVYCQQLKAEIESLTQRIATLEGK